MVGLPAYFLGKQGVRDAMLLSVIDIWQVAAKEADFIQKSGFNDSRLVTVMETEE